MNLLQIRDAFITYWIGAYSTTPTLYENVTLPDSLKTNPFVTFEIEFTKPSTVGNRTTSSASRLRGFIAVVVNVPKGSGNRQSYTLSQEVVSLLEHRRIDNKIAMGGAYIESDGYDGEHFRSVITVPFEVTVS